MSNKVIKIVSWNINGYRSIINKNFIDVFLQIDADIFALQETKLQRNQLSKIMKNIPGYKSIFAFSLFKKGYSGVVVYSKLIPEFINCNVGAYKFYNEGRIVQINFGQFIFFSVYFPNGRMNQSRLKYKIEFYEFFFSYLKKYLKSRYSIIVVGDFNIAHMNIDLKNPSSNFNKSGFLSVERALIDKFSKMGFVDTFRLLYPNCIKYSWWSYRSRSRRHNLGWRIDYCFISKDILTRRQLKKAFICNDVLGSDHCPVGLELLYKD